MLILNASGGLEKDKPADYAMQLNSTAQVRLVEMALPLMPRGGRIIFVTSHMAHFYREKPVYGPYEPVAASKYAGERALRARGAEFEMRGIAADAAFNAEKTAQPYSLGVRNDEAAVRAAMINDRSIDHK